MPKTPSSYTFEVLVERSIGKVIGGGEMSPVSAAFALIGEDVENSDSGGDYNFTLPSAYGQDFHDERLPSKEVKFSISVDVEQEAEVE